MAHFDIIASYWTVAGECLPNPDNMASPHDLRARIEASAKAGFTGMGFNFDDVDACRARYSDTEVRAMFAANGMKWIELEALIDWFADGERGAKSANDRRRAFAQAAAWGAFQIKVAGDMTGDWPLDRMAEAFARLCDEAADEGLRITLELLPISNLPRVEQAMQVVGAAGRPNGGMMFDAWHVARGGIALSDIASLPAGLCTGIELDDGPRVPAMDDLYQEMINCRALPGEGEFDLVGLLRAARDAGFNGPYGVELLSPEQRARPVEEAARLAWQTTHQVLEKALG